MFMSSRFSSPQHAYIADDAWSQDEHLAAQTTARLLITAATRGQVETVARRIHTASDRARFPFVQTRARDLPRTPAAWKATWSDLLDRAAGGSMLVSDIEEMSRSGQDILFNLLSDPARDTDGLADVRLVAGTTESLFDRVRSGEFSERLFYRLNVIHLVAD
jgi:DNA-binding NtrC family response regulator